MNSIQQQLNLKIARIYFNGLDTELTFSLYEQAVHEAFNFLKQAGTFIELPASTRRIYDQIVRTLTSLKQGKPISVADAVETASLYLPAGCAGKLLEIWGLQGVDASMGREDVIARLGSVLDIHRLTGVMAILQAKSVPSIDDLNQLYGDYRPAFHTTSLMIPGREEQAVITEQELFDRLYLGVGTLTPVDTGTSMQVIVPEPAARLAKIKNRFTFNRDLLLYAQAVTERIIPPINSVKIIEE